MSTKNQFNVSDKAKSKKNPSKIIKAEPQLRYLNENLLYLQYACGTGYYKYI